MAGRRVEVVSDDRYRQPPDETGAGVLLLFMGPGAGAQEPGFKPMKLGAVHQQSQHGVDGQRVQPGVWKAGVREQRVDVQCTGQRRKVRGVDSPTNQLVQRGRPAC